MNVTGGPAARSLGAWRVLALGALLSVLFGWGLPRLLDGAPSSTGAGVHARMGFSPRSALSVLPDAAIAPVSHALGAAEPAYRIAASGGVYTAGNPAQGLGLRFDRAGVRIRSRGAEVALSASAAGYGSSLRPLGDATLSVARNRAVYARPGLEEWYVNGPLGVEQGFTLPRAPAGRASGALTLAMTVSGDARASLEDSGRSILLTGPDGASLRYGSLVATDAGGHALRSRLALDGRTILIEIDARGARYPLRIDPLLEGAALPTGSESEGTLFGYSVALSEDDDTALVGGRDAAGAWVFVRTGSTWEQQGPELKIEEEEAGGGGESCGGVAGCGFGRSVALSADGDTALVGATGDRGNRGAAWVFTRTGSTWAQPGVELEGGEDERGKARFGRSVSLSADGDTALVGGPADRGGDGAAWVFTRVGESSWTQQGKLIGGEEVGSGNFGSSVALSGDASTALIGGRSDDESVGAAWVFARTGGTWSQQGAKLTGGEESGAGQFGYSVALSAFGNTALIGGPADAGGAGAAWAFTRSEESKWSQQGAKLTDGENRAGQFGASVALSGDGDVGLVGAPHEAGGPQEGRVGAVWTFSRSGATWQLGERLVSPKDEKPERFGASVALSADGTAALVGVPGQKGTSGAVWSYLEGSVPPPTVTAIEPASGPTTGTTSVTIIGTGFGVGTTTVDIGGAAASSVRVLSEDELTALTPAHEAGAQEVVVSDGDGVSSAGPDYTFLAPPVTPGSTVTTTTTTVTKLIASPSAGQGVLASQTSTLPSPVLGVSGNLTPVAGLVRVKLPGSNRFVTVTGTRQVPFGTVIDATHGRVTITTIGPHGAPQTIIYYGGEFELTQGSGGMVVALLKGGDFALCPTRRERGHLASISSSGKHVVRKLWSSGHGSYSTKGNYAAGAVLGTVWLTEDLCDGTIVHVVTDSVEVTNLVTHHRYKVRAGHSYFAKAP
jgi:hypothetical protein